MSHHIIPNGWKIPEEATMEETKDGPVYSPEDKERIRRAETYAQIPNDTTYELVEGATKTPWFRIRLERVLLGLVLCLGLALAYARFTEQDRVSQLDRALEWVVEAQKAQIGALKATRDSLVANDQQLLEMMRFHSRWHAEQEKAIPIQPEGD